MQKYFFLLLVASLSISSCTKMGEDIIGYWVYDNYDQEDSVTVYNRVKDMPDDAHGFAFKENGVFLEHKNAGWCGTPPISYANYEGTWTRTDSLVTIEVGYWGGTSRYQWEIYSVNRDHLSVKVISSETIEQNY